MVLECITIKLYLKKYVTLDYVLFIQRVYNAKLSVWKESSLISLRYLCVDWWLQCMRVLSPLWAQQRVLSNLWNFASLIGKKG